MSKKFALCIGINYLGTSNQLYGCINDVLLISNILKTKLGYDEVVILRDDLDESVRPTKHKIMQELANIIIKNKQYNEIWIHYSGHGSQIRDLDGDEISGMDSVIVPVDFKTNGFILDDTIFSFLKRINCKINLVFDCCNSGSVCDLQYSFEYKADKNILLRSQLSNKNRILTNNPNVICISGCGDLQTSADTYSSELNQSIGALTNSLVISMSKFNYSGLLFDIYVETVKKLKNDGYTQIPVLSSSSQIPNYKLNPTTNILQINKSNIILPINFVKNNIQNNFADTLLNVPVDKNVKIIDKHFENLNFILTSNKQRKINIPKRFSLQFV